MYVVKRKQKTIENSHQYANKQLSSKIIYCCLVLSFTSICVLPSYAQQLTQDQHFIHQYCATPDTETPAEPSEPATSRPDKEGWVDLPKPESKLGALAENIEKTELGKVKIYSYPKYYRDASGSLNKVDTTLQTSSHDDWDYEVTRGIWSLKIRKDGTFQAQHKGDTFTYRLQSLGIGSGEQFNPLELGEPDFTNFQVAGDTIRWSNVFADVDVSVRYIEDILKVDVIAKEAFINDLRTEVNNGNLDPADYLTARFDIPNVFINSQAKQNGVN